VTETRGSPDARGALYLVATPIGNMGDITLRAVETLRACDAVLAEDTRRTRALLSHLGIGGKSVLPLHAHSDAADVERAADRVAQGERLALVTDAGTPGVSDPGESLVQAVLARRAAVIPLPGPSAVLAALVASGLASDGRFRFLGFLPRDGVARQDAVAVACETPEPVVLFEAPSRIARTLEELARATPARSACVARELTKVHEEFVRGPLSELAASAREWLGEVVLVLGAHSPGDRNVQVDDDALDRRIDEELAAGGHVKTIAARLAAWSGRPRRDVYERIVQRKR
jgi:16S rRNA (cytidine1402-2'-O)-methyltransferase